MLLTVLFYPYLYFANNYQHQNHCDMYGELNEMQIEHLLLSQSIGHLGCTDGKKPYVLPITYLYDTGYIYSQTWAGKKLDIMRINPLVCLEVYRHTDMFNYESAIVWGQFEELSDEEAIEARTLLYENVFQLMTPAAVHLHEHGTTAIVDDEDRYKAVIYRIKLEEKTGRFKTSQ